MIDKGLLWNSLSWCDISACFVPRMTRPDSKKGQQTTALHTVVLRTSRRGWSRLVRVGCMKCPLKQRHTKKNTKITTECRSHENNESILASWLRADLFVATRPLLRFDRFVFDHHHPLLVRNWCWTALACQAPHISRRIVFFVLHSMLPRVPQIASFGARSCWD